LYWLVPLVWATPQTVPLGLNATVLPAALVRLPVFRLIVEVPFWNAAQPLTASEPRST